jgi:hypothetical protein
MYRRSSQRLVVLLAKICLLSGLFTSVNAEPLPPITEKTAKMIGIAATTTESARQVLMGMVSYCSQFGGKSTDAFANAFSAWLQRHQEYLAESARAKADLIALVKRPEYPPSYLKDLEQMYEVGIPEMIAAKIARNTKPIAILPNARAKASRCVFNAQMINDGLWDLKKNHPDAAQFLDERLRRRTK